MKTRKKAVSDNPEKVIKSAIISASKKAVAEAKALNIPRMVAKPDGLYLIAPDGSEKKVKSENYTAVKVKKKRITIG